MKRPAGSAATGRESAWKKAKISFSEIVRRQLLLKVVYKYDPKQELRKEDADEVRRLIDTASEELSRRKIKNAKEMKPDPLASFIPRVRTIMCPGKDLRVLPEDEDTKRWVQEVLNARSTPYATQAYTEMEKLSKFSIFVPDHALVKRGGRSAVESWWTLFKATLEGHYRVDVKGVFRLHDMAVKGGHVFLVSMRKAIEQEILKKETRVENSIRVHVGGGMYFMEHRGESVEPAWGEEEEEETGASGFTQIPIPMEEN